MTDCGGSTVTAAISGCRLLAPEGNVEKVVTVCTDFPETGRGGSEARMGPRGYWLRSLDCERW